MKVYLLWRDDNEGCACRDQPILQGVYYCKEAAERAIPEHGARLYSIEEEELRG